jgi:hypothetical protein
MKKILIEIGQIGHPGVDASAKLGITAAFLMLACVCKHSTKDLTEQERLSD